MNKIKCKCGNTIVLDYSKAEHLDTTGNKNYYLWTCKSCGQDYQQEVASSIKIKDKDIIKK